jgi:hypothetical protein
MLSSIPLLLLPLLPVPVLLLALAAAPLTVPRLLLDGVRRWG